MPPRPSPLLARARRGLIVHLDHVVQDHKDEAGVFLLVPSVVTLRRSVQQVSLTSLVRLFNPKRKKEGIDTDNPGIWPFKNEEYVQFEFFFLVCDTIWLTGLLLRTPAAEEELSF